ncbi:hypothetical protein RvY_10811 [Ramazzottius varieornatus]|uniref:Uncharacterized protein n=1 Tax=Ramazzottius varieornatus TaxID=947166 RepID=A0A1D1VIG1_RAMVA|nr:hypothetical protein RvY_10811 [Ramazzottius varieornatus]
MSLLRVSAMEDETGQPVEIMDLEPALQILGYVPPPLQFLQALLSSGWKLDSKWQSLSYIHKVVRDLYTKQHFAKLVLIYCKPLEVVIVAGEQEARAGEPLEAKLLTPSVDSTDTNPDGGTEQPGLVTFILPGNSRTARISGNFRREIDQELWKLSSLLKRLGRKTSPGWIIAITDTEEVTYYAEKQVRLDDLKSSRVGETRDDVLSRIFGESRVVNWRTAARKEERRACQKAREERLRKRQEGAGDEEPDAGTDVASPSNFGMEEFEKESGEEGESYINVLKLIGGSHK